MRGLALLGIVALAGCGEAPAVADAAVDATPYALAARALGGDGGIEMRLGFQGFRYTRVVLTAGEGAPASTPGSARLEIDGFEPATQRFRAIEFRELARDHHESDALMVYANDITLSRAVGRRATLTFELSDGRRRATTTLVGTIGWDPNCVEDAEYRCQPAATRTDGGAP